MLSSGRSGPLVAGRSRKPRACIRALRRPAIVCARLAHKPLKRVRKPIGWTRRPAGCAPQAFGMRAQAPKACTSMSGACAPTPTIGPQTSEASDCMRRVHECIPMTRLLTTRPPSLPVGKRVNAPFLRNRRPMPSFPSLRLHGLDLALLAGASISTCLHAQPISVDFSPGSMPAG